MFNFNAFQMKRSFILLIFSIIFSSPLLAQYHIQGQILSANTRKPIASAHIIMPDSSNGYTSNEKGFFRFETLQKQAWFWIEAVGFEKQKVYYQVKTSQIDLGKLLLEPKTYALSEINISASLVKPEKAAVNISSINTRRLKNELGDQPLPLLMQQTPGVFSVRNGGGSGDASLSIRGFHQDNVAILLNGIPINGVENGLVYWSNWLGLNDAAASIQIQKGPGFTNMATNAVGGSINIITTKANEAKGGNINFQFTDYGNQKTTLIMNSGRLDNGWKLSFMGAYFSGPGYIDATAVKGFSYFFTANKQIGHHHHLNITLLGSPQHHQQRSLKLSYQEIQTHGFRYNKDWGAMDGKVKNASENFYHKPFLSINHDWQISPSQNLSNTIYVSYGTGGGKWSDSFNYAPSIFNYRTASGQIDWNTIYTNNANNTTPYVLANGDTVSGYSINIGTNFLASHIQSGWMSTYEQKFGKNITLTTGLHYSYLNSFLREEISDLMGGKFYIEDYGWSLSGVAGRNQIKTLGDIIKVNNHSIIHQLTTYSRLKYETKKLFSYIALGANNHWYQRIDYFNYINHPKSKIIAKPGFDLRTGLNYRLTAIHRLYFNTAYISRAPYFKYVFGNFTNVPVQNLQNEKIQDFEVGYQLTTEKFKSNLNLFYTQWNNVSMLSNEYVQLEDNQQSRAMVNGLNSTHKGIEWEMQYQLSASVKVAALLSLGDYRWQNDVNAKLINDNNVVFDTVHVYAKNLYVGGTAQNQLGGWVDIRLMKTSHLKVSWTYYDKIYANFDPTQRNNPDRRQLAYRFPSYHLVNAYLNVPARFGKLSGLLQLNAYNLLNQHYIETGEDGLNGNLSDFRGYWAMGSNFNFSIKVFF
jgi:iron complex outermembrane receptor protein